MKHKILFPLLFLIYCSQLNLPTDKVSNFILLDTDDKYIDFYEIMETKKLSVIFFGYSHCPNVCYNTLSKFNKISSHLDKSSREQIEFIFISIDPLIDDRAKLLTMKNTTDPRVLFLRGDVAEIEKIKKEFEIKIFETYENRNIKTSIIHSTTIFLIDRNHKIIYKLANELEADMIVKLINTYLLNS